MLITGAAGFIGSHLAEALIQKGKKVVCLLEPAEEGCWIRNLDADFVYGDITHKNSIYKALEGVTYIYHLAALLGGPDSQKIYQINYVGMKNLVEACLSLRIKIKRFLFTSSITAMGPTGNATVFDETVQCNPVSDYGKSKLLAEQFLLTFKGHLPTTIVRLPIVYGPRTFAGLYYFYKIINKGFQIDFGTAETNVGFVGDIVEGIISAAESPRTIGKIYHLGEDKIYTSREICNAIEKSLGKKTVRLKIPYPALCLVASIFELNAKRTGKKPFMTRRIIEDYLKHRFWRIDMSKAKREFGYETKTPFAEGAKITADWYKKEGFI